VDYQKFFAEVTEWINQVNQMVVQHGMESDQFWNWVTQSMGEFGNKYANNKLVVKQMAMLYQWLEEVYAEGRNNK